MQNSVAKKIFAVGSAAAMAIALAAPLSALAAVHADGTNVNKSGTVGMVIGGQFRPYTSAGAFLSYGFNSFASVVAASAEDSALPVGSFIPPQDGSLMCSDRGSDKGTCYQISGAMKYGFTSAAVFTGLGFSFKNTMSGDVSWMPSGATLISSATAAHLPGTLVNNNGTVQLMGGSGLLGIPDLTTFNSWGYSFGKVAPANAADKAMTQTGVMAARVAGSGLLSPSWTTSPSTSVVSGSVSASLASDSPAAGTVAINNATGATTGSSTVVTLAKFAFSGTGTVTQMQVKRVGVSADTIINNAYLYDGGTRLTDAASVGGSSLITFNSPSGLFTVSGSKAISVVVELAGTTSAGQTVGLQLTSFTVANGTPATVAISGNMFTTSQVTDLATAQFGTATPGDSASQTRDATKDSEVFRSSVVVNTRNMTMSRLILRNIGSVQQADINNFRLNIDGTQISQVQSMDANGYVYFSFSPVTLKAGTRVFSVLADIVSGSSRTFQYQIRNKADVDFTDTQYGTSVSASNIFPFGSNNAVTINSGSLTFQKTSDSPTGNVTDGTSDVSLAKYTVTAYGEAMKIETLKVGATSSNASVGSLRNGRVLVNGVQYGSTATLATSTGNTYSGGGTSYTLNYTVQPGSPVTVEVHADMYDNDAQGNSLANGNTVTAVIMAGSSNVQKLVSLGYTNGPTSYVLGNAITDVTGAATLTRNANYPSQTIPLPQTNYKLAAFSLVGSTSEDININSIVVNLDNSSTSLATGLNDVTAKIGGTVFGTIKGTLATSTASSTFSSVYTLAKSGTVPVEIYASIPTPTLGYTNDTFQAEVCVTGTAVSSAASVTACAAGQTISVGSGTIVAAQDASSPVAAIIAGNQTKTVAVFKFTSTNDAYTVNELTLSAFDATNVTSIVVKDSSGTIATMPGAASSTFSNLSIAVPANGTKVISVDLVLGDTGYQKGTSGANVKVTLHGYKYTPSSTGALNTAAAAQGTGVTGNNVYVYKVIPTITNVALPSTTLSAGTQTIYKFSMSSGGSGTLGWAKLAFNVATSTGVTVTSPQIWDADSNTQVSGTASSTYPSTGGLVFEFWPNAEQQVSGSKNYAVKATVAVTGTGAKNVSTNITQPSSYTAPVISTTATATNATLVWSDVSAQSHGLTSLDWNNDALVKNLPTDSQTLSASY